MDLATPEVRPGPPWIMEEMIAAEPGLAEPIVTGVREPAGRLARAVRRALEAGEHVAVVGCGTSEHAAMAIAELLADAARTRGLPAHRLASRQAFEAALEPWPGGLTIGVSHEAETAATVAALRAARRAGSAAALITANEGGPAAALADIVLVTPVLDRSWCHTVGYLSPMLAGGAIAAQLRGVPLDGGALADHLRASLTLGPAATALAAEMGAIGRLVVCGSGADRGTARELALKVEEGVRLPAVARELETQLHGHLVSADARCGLIVVVADPRGLDRREARAVGLLRAARRLGMPTGAIVARSLGAGWAREHLSSPPVVLPVAPVVRPVAPDVPALLACLTGSAIALQLLTLALVHAAGTNPDLIRRDDPVYRESAELAAGSLMG